VSPGVGCDPKLQVMAALLLHRRRPMASIDRLLALKSGLQGQGA